LLHLIDLTAADPIADYETIQAELKAYDLALSQRVQIIGLNKLDAASEQQEAETRAKLSQLTSDPIFSISAVTRTGLDPLLQEVWSTLDRVKE